MIKYLFIMSFICFVLQIKAISQKSYADSLEKKIASQEPGFEMIENLVILGQYYTKTGNPDSSVNKYEKAVNIAKALNDPELQLELVYSLIFDHYDDNPELVTRYSRLFIDLSESYKDTIIWTKGLYLIGTAYHYLGNVDSAMLCANKSLSLLSSRDTILLYANYNLKGNLFRDKEIFDSSALYYHKAIEKIEQRKDTLNLGILLYNLADVYFNNGQIDNARKYAEMGLVLNTRMKNINDAANNLNLLGRISAMEKKFDSALLFYNQAETLYEQCNRPDEIYDLYNNYGDVYLSQKKYDLAIKSLNDALKGYMKLDFKKGIATVLMNKGAANHELRKYGVALKLFDSSFTIAKECGLLQLQSDIAEYIAAAYDSVGNYAKAYEYLTLHMELADSVFTLERDKEINKLNIKYETEKRVAENLTLKTENLTKDLELQRSEVQRNTFLFTALAIVIITTFLILYLRQRAHKDKIIAQQQIQRLEEEKKLMAARSLVEGQEEERKRIASELHDGLGVLLSTTRMHFSALKISNPENKSLFEKGTKLLEQATTDVRRISHNMMPGLLTKLGLYEAVEDLFENLADNEDLNVTCQITGDQERLPENKEIMLYRVIQEMVNNTIKYAQARKLEMKINIQPRILDIFYSDDGIGFNVEEKIESQSIGLKSIHSRISFLNGKVEIDSRPGAGVKYHIEVPV